MPHRGRKRKVRKTKGCQDRLELIQSQVSKQECQNFFNLEQCSSALKSRHRLPEIKDSGEVKISNWILERSVEECNLLLYQYHIYIIIILMLLNLVCRNRSVLLPVDNHHDYSQHEEPNHSESNSNDQPSIGTFIVRGRLSGSSRVPTPLIASVVPGVAIVESIASIATIATIVVRSMS